MRTQKTTQVVWLLLPILYLLWSHWPILHGHLLSDSFSHLYNCHQWSDNQMMMSRLGHLFYQSINEAGGADMYRPLAIVSYCSDYMLWGVNPMAHKLSQLLLHIFSGLLLWVLLFKICHQHKINVSFATMVATLYLIFPMSPEISAWLATRADSLVQIFMFFSLYALWRKNTFWACIWLLLALLSKESAIMIVPMLVSIVWFNQPNKSSIKQRSQETIYQAWPFISIVLVYFFWRWILFGQATDVYAKQGGVITRMAENLPHFHETLYKLMFGPVGDLGISALWLGLTILLICLGVWSCFKTKKSNVIYLISFNIIIILLALLTQFNSTDISGGGARVLYIITPWMAGIICLVWLYKKSIFYRSIFIGYLLLTALLHHKILAQWSMASSVSFEIVGAVPGATKNIAGDDWALLLVPEYIGAALVARNAQGAMVTPPFQDKPYLDYLVPFIWRDLELWRDRANSSFVNQFKRNSSQPNEQPLYALCLSRQGGFVKQQINNDDFNSQQSWQSFWHNFITENKCYQ